MNHAITSAPVSPIQAPVLHRLGQVLGRHGLVAGQVGDDACHFEDAVVWAGREAQLPHGQFERALAGLVEPADLPQQPRRKLRIVVPALPLDAARRLDTSAQLFGGGALLVGAQLSWFSNCPSREAVRRAVGKTELVPSVTTLNAGRGCHADRGG